MTAGTPPCASPLYSGSIITAKRVNRRAAPGASPENRLRLRDGSASCREPPAFFGGAYNSPAKLGLGAHFEVTFTSKPRRQRFASHVLALLGFLVTLSCQNQLGHIELTLLPTNGVGSLPHPLDRPVRAQGL